MKHKVGGLLFSVLLLISQNVRAFSVYDTVAIVKLLTAAEKSDSTVKVNHALKAIQLADSLLLQLPVSDKTSRPALASLKEKANRLLAFYYRNEGNFEKELYYFQQCLQLRQQTNDKRNIASAYVNIGISYYRMGYIPRALDNFSKGITMLEEVKDTGYVATMFNNLGTVFTRQGEKKEALVYFNRGLNNYRQIDDYKGMAHSLNNIGALYYELGQTDTAFRLFNEAWEYAVKSESRSDLVSSYTNLGILHRDRGNLKLAEDNFTKALEANKSTNHKPGIAACYNQLANVYLLQKKYTNAVKFAQASLQLYTEQRNIEGLRNAEETLARIDSTTGNFKSALVHYHHYITYRDSLLNEQTQKAAIKNHLKYEFDKKEAESKALQEKKDALTAEEMQRQKVLRNSFIGGFAVMLLFAGVFFFQRNRISKEKLRSENLLLNILPAEVAEELKQNGRAEAKQFDNVTVFFSDFKSFTTLSEKLSPQELVNELHECFSAFDRIVSKYGIEKIKTVGDAYLCVAGLPTPNANHAADMVKAALEIQEWMKKRKEQNPHREGLYDIRVGINSGSVVAGIVGINKFAYDIWGDTVNTAARMEQNGEAGKVNISEATYELVKDKFTCEYRGEIEAKNKGKLKMYFV